MVTRFKECPYCESKISMSAKKCKFCGEWLDKQTIHSVTSILTPDTIIRQALEDKYEFHEVIGKGGMATVYRAVQKNLNRNVALKIIHQNLIHDTEFVVRFIREAELSASLSHPNIVTVYDVGSIGSVHYMAMEFLEGTDLQKIIKQNGVINYNQILEYIVPITDALYYIHKKGLIHRDIKSSNIFITKEGRPVLMDFGIAQASNGTKLTQTGTVIGTPEYMSPEQAQGKTIDNRTDLYSLGVVLYECLTGIVPFKGDNPLTTINLITNSYPKNITELNQQVPIFLCEITMKLLAKEPEKRFTNGMELIDKIKATNITEQSINPPKKNSTFVTKRKNSNTVNKKSFSKIFPLLISLVLPILLFLIFQQIFGFRLFGFPGRLTKDSASTQGISTNQESIENEQLINLYHPPTNSSEGSFDIQEDTETIKNSSNLELTENLNQDLHIESKKGEVKNDKISSQTNDNQLISNNQSKEEEDNTSKTLEILQSLNIVSDFLNEFDKNNAIIAWQKCNTTFSNLNEIELLKSNCYSKLLNAKDSQKHFESLFWAEAGLSLDPQNSSFNQIKNEVEKWFDSRRRYWQNINSGLLNELIFVEGGNFKMGSEGGDKDEEPIHNVTVENFFISKYEIKNEQYCSFLNHMIWNGTPLSTISEWINYKSGYSEIVLKNSEFIPIEGKLKHPVIEISWHGANQFCQWLGAKLPSEAQWEYAAKGGNRSKNYKYSGGNALDLFGWFQKNSSNGTKETGQKNPNELGIYDMTGNVWEWCSDWYSEDYYSSSSGYNPMGPVTGRNKVIRGGSWNFEENIQRVTNRHAYQPQYGGIHIGFRIIRIP